LALPMGPLAVTSLTSYLKTCNYTEGPQIHSKWVHSLSLVALDSFLLLGGSDGMVELKILNDALAGIEFLVKFFRFHISQPPRPGTGGRI